MNALRLLHAFGLIIVSAAALVNATAASFDVKDRRAVDLTDGPGVDEPLKSQTYSNMNTLRTILTLALLLVNAVALANAAPAQSDADERRVNTDKGSGVSEVFI
ncbi:hypothetical protein NM688_g214 [Phlebia brevispora]|uniref:Uncharacterized protein n=1 Tax=Phlebia brevispora TaxID=194682 RepID=A0ACC1TF71_9APHY|nr:hypothetical protein NM688_g214 [Phlebia brevispora]